MSPGSARRNLDVVLALEHEQVADLEGLAAIADVEQAVLGHRSLVDAKHAHLADERIDRDLEHVREHVPRRVGRCGERLGIGPLAAQELGRVAPRRDAAAA